MTSAEGRHTILQMVVAISAEAISSQNVLLEPLICPVSEAGPNVLQRASRLKLLV